MGGIARSRINEYFQFPLQKAMLFCTLTNNMTRTVSRSQQHDSRSHQQSVGEAYFSPI